MIIDNDLNLRLRRLQEMKDKVLARHARTPPDGLLRGYRYRDGFQYFLRKNTQDRHGIYLTNNKIETAAELAQYEYEELVIGSIDAELQKPYCRCAGSADIWPWEQVYMQLPEFKRVLVEPLELPDAEFLNKWLNQQYVGKEFAADDPLFFTGCNVRVRSKAEVIIGSLFEKYNIPYLYEKPLYVKGSVLYPDFTILDLRYRRELIWEHFGLMDDPSYSSAFVWKINQYDRANCRLGDNLIISLESASNPLDTRQLSANVKQLALYLGTIPLQQR